LTTINTYLTFKGTCEAAFNLYKSVFGGELQTFSRFEDMPPNPDAPLSAEMKKHVMHVTLPIGENTLMGSDAGGEWSPNLIKGTNYSISLGLESQENADQVFAELSEGGQVTMPKDNTFWGDYFGMCTDQFGIQWMINAAKRRV
jgi:PhnB protein